MFTFLKKKTDPQESFDAVFEREKQQKNETVKRLIQDFPWLWAIKRYMHRDHADTVKVNQDMNDLKMLLAQPSLTKGFSLWGITTQFSEVFNMEAAKLEGVENIMWAQAIMEQTYYHHSILHLVKVSSSPERKQQITIFRQPGKSSLNELVKHVAELHGISPKWQIPKVMD